MAQTTPMTPAELLIELQYVDCGGCVDGDCPHETANECVIALIDELKRIASHAQDLVSRTDKPTAWTLKETSSADGSCLRVKRDRSIQFAGPENDCNGGARIVEGKYLHGSGLQAFGGVKEWPYIQLHAGLPVDRYDLRDELGEKLRATVDAFVDAHPELKVEVGK